MKHLWPCGHERTPENTMKMGKKNAPRCKTCRQAYVKDYNFRRDYREERLRRIIKAGFEPPVRPETPEERGSRMLLEALEAFKVRRAASLSGGAS